MDSRVVERLRRGQARLHDERLAEIASRERGLSLPERSLAQTAAGELGEALVRDGALSSADLDRFSLEIDLIDRLETSLCEFLPESVREQAVKPKRRAGKYILSERVEKADSGEAWKAWDVGFGEWVLWARLERTDGAGESDDAARPTRAEAARDFEERADGTLLVLDWPESDSVPGLGILEGLLSGGTPTRSRSRLSPLVKAALGIAAVLLMAAVVWSLISVRSEEARSEAHRQADLMLAPVESRMPQIQELFGRVEAAEEPGVAELLEAVDQATQAALAEAPDHLRARALRGWMLHLGGRDEEAVQLFDAVLAQSPDDHQAALGHSSSRLALLSKSHPLEPLVAPRTDGIDLLVVRATDEERATVEEVLQVLQKVPEGALNERLVRARAAMADADFDRVGEILLSGDRTPESLADEALGLLTWSALAAGRSKDAEAHADLLIQRRPHGPGLVLRALARAAQERFEEALSDLGTLPEAVSSDPAISSLGPVWSFLATGESDFVEELDRLVEATPEASAPLLARSFVRLHLGDVEGSSQDAAQAVELAPQDPEAHYRLALTLESGFAAVAALDRALEIAPGTVEYLGQRSLAHLQAGQLAEAVRDARRASESDPTDPRWTFALGVAQIELGNTEGGEAALTRTIESGYSEPVAFLQRGRARLAREDCAGALADLSLAEELQGGITHALEPTLREQCGR